MQPFLSDSLKTISLWNVHLFCQSTSKWNCKTFKIERYNEHTSIITENESCAMEDTPNYISKEINMLNFKTVKFTEQGCNIRKLKPSSSSSYFSFLEE